MNKIIKITLISALMLGAAIFANAQAVTTGTIDFNVTVAPAFDLRSDGAGSTTGTGISATGATTVNQALGATITVTDASPNVDNSTLVATLPIRMRSNAPYSLMGTRTGTSTVSRTDFESSDIRMVLTYTPRSSGALSSALVNASGTDTSVFTNAMRSANVGSLSSVATQIGFGDRISNGGNNSSTSNFIRASLEFSVDRAYYTPTTTGAYTDSVTLSIIGRP